MGSADRSHVALLAFPFGTHAAPLLSLGLNLASSAPHGTTFSFLSNRRPVSLPPNSAIKFYEIADGSDPEHEGHVHPEEEVRVFMEETPGNYKKALEAAVDRCGGQRVTCIVADAFLWFVGDIAAEFGVHWVPLWTGGPCSFLAHLYTDMLRNKIGTGKEADPDEDLQFLPGLSGFRVRDLPDDIVTGDLTGAFASLLHRMSIEIPRSAAAIAINTFEGLHPDIDADLASKFKKSLPIGPLNLLNPTLNQPDRFSCLAWLDKFEPHSVAYVSFGTLAALTEAELVELASGLEQSGVPFLWSLKEPGQLPAGFLDRTKDRGLVVPWVPQAEALKHVAVGASLSHCGWNSVMESVTSGVPMLCRPFLGDQTMNARAVSHVWKVGVTFENGTMTRANVAEAMKKVVVGEEGRKMRERAAAIREMAAGSVRPGGSSVQNFKALLDIVIAR
uniref:UDP-glucose: anthocyanidin 3-O-glucosyltransferase n=1 Tax=Freesia hybrid cultivar TaxID=867926 RepID=E2IQH7_9ASPA|nr:UDP-glucose: anthocyanidin 3-O-glucosyltransferase [Freesia hybrid cultivar]